MTPSTFTVPPETDLARKTQSETVSRTAPRFTRHGRRASKTSYRLRNTGMVKRILDCLPEACATPEALARTADRFCSSEDEAKDLLHDIPDALGRLSASHCKPRGRIACLHCPVRMMCNKWRTERVDTDPKPGQPVIAEFFAGAGGMSLGFEQAGFHTKLAVDIELDATHTYLVNRPHMPEENVVCGDMQQFLDPAKLNELRHVDGIVGGPPCQTFSLVGYRTKGYHNADEKILEDDRTWLPTAFARLIAEVKPRFAVMENVAAFRTALNGQIRKGVIRTLEAARYSVAEASVWAHKNGAPQRRKRYILIAIRAYGGGGKESARAKAEAIKDALETGTKDGTTVGQALAALEPFGNVPAGGGSEYARNGDAETWNHYARRHNPTDLKIYAALKPGQTARELVEEQPGLIKYDTSSFGDKYRKLDSNGFSPTIPAHLKKDANSFILDGVNRGVTPREAATLQGFPTSYVFVGSQSHQFMQIGNAVPPPVAKAVATLIKDALFT